MHEARAFDCRAIAHDAFALQDMYAAIMCNRGCGKPCLLGAPACMRNNYMLEHVQCKSTGVLGGAIAPPRLLFRPSKGLGRVKTLTIFPTTHQLCVAARTAFGVTARCKFMTRPGARTVLSRRRPPSRNAAAVEGARSKLVLTRAAEHTRGLRDRLAHLSLRRRLASPRGGSNGCGSGTV